MRLEQGLKRHISLKDDHPVGGINTLTMNDDITATGIFGGSFNPIHNGHLSVATHIMAHAGLKEVWLTVSPQNPLKAQSELIDDNTRVDMAQAAVAGIAGVSVCTVEMDMPRPSYTWLTMRTLTERYPRRRFTLLIGADNWLCFNRWRNADELLRRYNIIVYPRKGCNIDTATMPTGVSYCDMPLIDVSSTDIRRRIRQHLSISHLVPAAVEKIIKERRLYL